MNQVQQFFEYIFNSIKIWVIVQPWQSGIRVRRGRKIKKISNGMFFRIPYLDSVFIQETRLRVAEIAIQTLTTKDLKTITINSAFGYTIIDVEQLYNTLYHPESTLKNIAMSEVANFIFKNNLDDVTPDTIEKAVMDKLRADDYGLEFKYFKITNFAVVRTFRLIQDHSWTEEGLKMDDKK